MTVRLGGDVSTVRIPRYGVLLHDRWASYLACGSCEHALCGARLLRELKRSVGIKC